MKQIIFLFMLIFFLSSCSFAADKLPQDIEKKPETLKEKVETLADEDPRRQKVMTLTWQIQYYREQLKTIELKHMIKCYQSKEYRNTLSKIENLNKQIRTLMLL
jgi:Na+-transporting methylmalonyl-CoA/oxaloacetate decarboxylase gamma subunit